MKLRDWAFTGSYDFFTHRVRSLAVNDLLPEKWSHTGKDDCGILKNYLYFTFDKLWNDREAAPDENKQSFIFIGNNEACFNTGLFDRNWQCIYFYCEKNPNDGFQPWMFKSFLNDYTIKYSGIGYDQISKLRRADYFQKPCDLIFDTNLEIIPQWNHIIDDEENYLRIPESLRQNGRDFCRQVIEGAIKGARKRIEANYKTVVPQFYRGRLQLLLPLYLTNQEHPDLALVLSRDDDKKLYFGHTCLTIEMAYNNARVIARPDSYWLLP